MFLKTFSFEKSFNDHKRRSPSCHRTAPQIRWTPGHCSRSTWRHHRQYSTNLTTHWDWKWLVLTCSPFTAHAVFPPSGHHHFNHCCTHMEVSYTVQTPVVHVLSTVHVWVDVFVFVLSYMQCHLLNPPVDNEAHFSTVRQPLMPPLTVGHRTWREPRMTWPWFKLYEIAVVVYRSKLSIIHLMAQLLKLYFYITNTQFEAFFLKNLNKLYRSINMFM